MKRSLLLFITILAVGLGVWEIVSGNRLVAAGTVWALLAITVIALAIYRIRIGSYPQHFLRSGALAGINGSIHRIDVIGASLTVLTTAYSILLVLLLADALIDSTIQKFVRLLFI